MNATQETLGAMPNEREDPARPLERYAAGIDPRRKSVALAHFLSLMPGLGQVYVGFYRQGFLHATVVAGIIAVLATDPPMPLPPLLGIFLAFFYLYNVVDAGRRAAFYNQALAGIEGVKLPADLTLPGPGGSLAGGAVLVIVGMILLSHTLGGFSLEWLEDWWPMAPILFGVYLIAKSVQERGGKR